MAPGEGSSSEEFFWVASRICLSPFITSSRARTDLSRPTNSGTTMCGNTTMSRNGSTGRILLSDMMHSKRPHKDKRKPNPTTRTNTTTPEDHQEPTKQDGHSVTNVARECKRASGAD